MDRITIVAAAERAGFNRSTLHRWIQKGKLKPRRTPGGKPYFTEADVAALAGGVDGTPAVVVEVARG